MPISRTVASFDDRVGRILSRVRADTDEAISTALDPLTAICKKYNGKLETSENSYATVDDAQTGRVELYSIVNQEEGGLVLVRNEVNLSTTVRSTRIQYASNTNTRPRLVQDFEIVYKKEPVISPPQ